MVVAAPAPHPVGPLPADQDVRTGVAGEVVVLDPSEDPVPAAASLDLVATTAADDRVAPPPPPSRSLSPLEPPCHVVVAALATGPCLLAVSCEDHVVARARADDVVALLAKMRSFPPRATITGRRALGSITSRPLLPTIVAFLPPQLSRGVSRGRRRAEQRGRGKPGSDIIVAGGRGIVTLPLCAIS